MRPAWFRMSRIMGKFQVNSFLASHGAQWRCWVCDGATNARLRSLQIWYRNISVAKCFRNMITKWSQKQSRFHTQKYSTKATPLTCIVGWWGWEDIRKLNKAITLQLLLLDYCPSTLWQQNKNEEHSPLRHIVNLNDPDGSVILPDVRRGLRR